MGIVILSFFGLASLAGTLGLLYRLLFYFREQSLVLSLIFLFFIVLLPRVTISFWQDVMENRAELRRRKKDGKRDELVPIKRNTQLVIDQLGSLSEINFGLNRDSVAWVEDYIERQRTSPDLSQATIDKLVEVFGSFLGECIIANAGGDWQWSAENGWSITFPDNNHAYPFNKIRKLFENGPEGGDSIIGIYDNIVNYLPKT
jgi:hypothetical protein